MVLCKYGPSSLGGAAVIPGFDPESVAHEPRQAMEGWRSRSWWVSLSNPGTVIKNGSP